MTSNHGYSRHPFSRQESRRVDRRPDGALLAGVCAGLADRLGWNAWALRGLFLFGLFIQTIPVGIAYVVLAVVMPRLGPGAVEKGSGAAPSTTVLESEVLSAREKRIADLERRFRDLESGQGD